MKETQTEEHRHDNHQIYSNKAAGWLMYHFLYFSPPFSCSVDTQGADERNAIKFEFLNNSTVNSRRHLFSARRSGGLALKCQISHWLSPFYSFPYYIMLKIWICLDEYISSVSLYIFWVPGCLFYRELKLKHFYLEYTYVSWSFLLKHMIIAYDLCFIVGSHWSQVRLDTIYVCMRNLL